MLKEELEIWRPVVGYEGRYEVSGFGNVRSVLRNKEMSKFESNLKPYYLRVGLRDENGQKKFSVHRLVAFAFQDVCGKWFEGAEVNHRDENSHNNYASNLEWVCSEDNSNYGSHCKNISESLHKTKGNPVGAFNDEGVMVLRFNGIKDAYKKGYTNVWRAIKKGSFHKGYKWKYISEYTS